MALLTVVALMSGCSIKKYAINRVGDALASGDSVYETDEDLELVGDALPFGLKLVESLLVESPNHRGLLLTACKGFVLYSYAYVDYQAQVAAQEDLDRAQVLRSRARKLYLRGLRYGLRGLERSYPEIEKKLVADPETAVRTIKKKQKDLPFLYWTSAALGLAISVSRNDAEMLARLPEVEALLDRALELDESWDEGALHEFQIILAGAKPGRADLDTIKRHYDRAMELSRGKRASLYLAYAETVSVTVQDQAEFRSLLGKALAVDPDGDPNHRLMNLLSHRRAGWLLERVDELILQEEPTQPSGENR